MTEEKTSLGLSWATKNRLDNYGKKGETYDELLNRMMDALGIKVPVK